MNDTLRLLIKSSVAADEEHCDCLDFDESIESVRVLWLVGWKVTSGLFD
jgi:hypothetical protein